jgi:hypothetical protein
MHALAATKLQFALRLLQTLLQTLLRLRATAPQPLLERLQRRRREEEVTGVEVRALDLFHALSDPSQSVGGSVDRGRPQPPAFLFGPRSNRTRTRAHSSDGGTGRGLEEGRGATDLHLDIQHTDPPPVRHVAHGAHARAVVVAAEDGVLDEAAFVDERQEGFFAGEVVFSAVLFVGAR